MKRQMKLRPIELLEVEAIEEDEIAGSSMLEEHYSELSLECIRRVPQCSEKALPVLNKALDIIAMGRHVISANNQLVDIAVRLRHCYPSEVGPIASELLDLTRLYEEASGQAAESTQELIGIAVKMSGGRL